MKEACRLLQVNGEGKLLLAKRAEGDYAGGYWSALGGKVDPGESPEEALIREVQEEAGLAISGLKLFRKYSNEDWVTHFFAAQATGDLVLDPTEHSEAGYFSLGEMAMLPLAFDHLEVFRDYLENLQAIG